MTPAEPRRFILVTAEAGIAISEGSGDYFSLDHLFIDQDGIPTLVEVKRSTDPRLRREVIGQMLEYAANASAFWSAERLRTVYERRCEKAALDPETELQALDTAGTAVSPDDIWEKVSSNLRQERLRLVFIADKFAPETQRNIEFLNRQMQLTEVYAVEVKQYAGVGMKTLVPRVLNPSVLQADRRAAVSGVGEMWTANRFYQDVLERHGEVAVKIFRQIDGWVQSQPQLSRFFGRGKLDGSIQITYKLGHDPTGYEAGDTVIVTLWTYGTVEIEFQYMMTRPAFRSDETRETLRSQLMSSSTLDISINKIRMRPNIKWSEFAEPRNLDALFATMTWIIKRFDETKSKTRSEESWTKSQHPEESVLVRAGALMGPECGDGLSPGAAIELHSTMATQNKAVYVRLLRLTLSRCNLGWLDVRAMGMDREGCMDRRTHLEAIVTFCQRSPYRDGVTKN